MLGVELLTKINSFLYDLTEGLTDRRFRVYRSLWFTLCYQFENHCTCTQTWCSRRPLRHYCVTLCICSWLFIILPVPM